MGAVRGDIRSADLLDIRADSNIQGQIVARRLRIDDGAILKGSVEIQKPEKETQSATKAAAQPVKAEGAEAAAAPASEPSVEAEKGEPTRPHALADAVTRRVTGSSVLFNPVR